MGKHKKPTLKSMGQQLDQAHRLYAAGHYTRAAETLTVFKADADEVLAEQQKAMAEQMNHHLRLRRELHELTQRAVGLSREVKARREGDSEA